MSERRVAQRARTGQRDCPLQRPRCRVERAPSQRTHARGKQEFGGEFGRARLLGQVCCQLASRFRHSVDVRVAAGTEGNQRRPCDRHSLVWAQTGEHRVAHQRMSELVARPVALDQRLVGCAFERGGNMLHRCLRSSRQHLPVEAAPKHRGNADHMFGRWVQRVETGGDGLDHRPRHSGLVEQFFDQQWNAFCCRDYGREPVTADRAIARQHHVGGLALRKRPEAHDTRAGSSVHRLRKVVSRRRWHGADRADAQDRQCVQVVGEVLDQRQRIGVGPLQILEPDDKPARRGQPFDNAEHRLAASNDRGLAAVRRWSRRVRLGRQDVVELGQPRRQTFGACHLAAAQRLQQRLGDRSVRDGRAAGHGASDGYLDTPIARDAAEFA